MRNQRRGITAATVAGLALAWLTLFCGHCLALGSAAQATAQGVHCIHEDGPHDCCGKGGDHGCSHGGQLQAAPLPAADDFIPGAGELRPPAKALLPLPVAVARGPLVIRAGPDRERPAWRLPPRYLVFRVLRD